MSQSAARTRRRLVFARVTLAVGVTGGLAACAGEANTKAAITQTVTGPAVSPSPTPTATEETPTAPPTKVEPQLVETDTPTGPPVP